MMTPKEWLFGVNVCGCRARDWKKWKRMKHRSYHQTVSTNGHSLLKGNERGKKERQRLYCTTSKMSIRIILHYINLLKIHNHIYKWWHKSNNLVMCSLSLYSFIRNKFYEEKQKTILVLLAHWHFNIWSVCF